MLLRKFSGGEFCSEAHRQLFFDEQQRLALARLAECEQNLQTASQRREAKESHSFLAITPVIHRSTDFITLAVAPLDGAIDLALPAFEGRVEAFSSPVVPSSLAPWKPMRRRSRAVAGKIRLRAFGPAHPGARIQAPKLRATVVSAAVPFRGELQPLAELTGRIQGGPAAPVLQWYQALRCSPSAPCIPPVRLAPAPQAVHSPDQLPPLCGPFREQPSRHDLAIVPRSTTFSTLLPVATPPHPPCRLAAAARPALPMGGTVLAATGTEARRGAIGIVPAPLAAVVRIPIRQPGAAPARTEFVSLCPAGPVALPQPDPNPGAILIFADGESAIPATGSSLRLPATQPARKAGLTETPALGLPVAGEIHGGSRAVAGLEVGPVSSDWHLPLAVADRVYRTAVEAGLPPASGLVSMPARPARPGSHELRRAGAVAWLDTQVLLRAPGSRLAAAQVRSSQNLLRLVWKGHPRFGECTLAGESEALTPPWKPALQRPSFVPSPFHEGVPLPSIEPDRDEAFEDFRAKAVRGLSRRWPLAIPARIAAPFRRRRAWLAVAAMLVLALFLRRPPEDTVRAASVSGGGKVDAMLAQHWQEMQDRIVQRAAVNLQDDFRSGLSDWRGKANWAREWRYDAAGFVRTGSLALYVPSMTLNNYSVEFLGQIERKALGWAVRAEDFENYHAMKLVLDRPGPLPRASLVRYTVIRGKEVGRKQIPLPITVRGDSLFKIRVDVHGENFTTSIHGQVVDFWTDRRLSWGGIGFFSGKGEQSRIRWVEVSHQYDMLGRLCAWMAPNGMAPAEGGLNR